MEVKKYFNGVRVTKKYSQKKTLGFLWLINRNMCFAQDWDKEYLDYGVRLFHKNSVIYIKDFAQLEKYIYSFIGVYFGRIRCECLSPQLKSQL